MQVGGVGWWLPGSGPGMRDHQRAAKGTTQGGAPANASGHRRRGGAVVTVYADGPLILRGQFALAAQDGQPIPAGRRTVALCRCGRSAIKPFCDGSHARTGFHAPGGLQGRQAAENRNGGRGAWQALTSVDDAAAEPASEGKPAAY
jgi:CDGSH-type Zn-finger protein